MRYSLIPDPSPGRRRESRVIRIRQGLNIPRMGINMPNMGIREKVQVAGAQRGTSLADALFSTVQQRVLAYIFGQPERSFFATELIKLAGGGSGAVQRELGRLEESGLVSVTRVGTQKHYQANPQSPIFSELCGIAQKTVGLAEPLRTALKPLEKRIRAAFVYGSVAKKRDTAASDIDIMVISSSLTYADLFTALEDASQRLGRKVNPTVYSPREIGKRVKQGNAFVSRVLAQPKIWLVGGENDIRA
jgi:predicted nucleotidyltransferase